MNLQLDADGRIRLSPALVSSLVDSQFPQWAGLEVRPVSRPGWDNHTFRLGEDLLARFPSAERYASQVGKEARWLPFLAGKLPVAIPEVLAVGEPGLGYPWQWSVRRWIEGEPAQDVPEKDLAGLALELASFLRALWNVPSADGPPPGKHNFQRGRRLASYDRETRSAIMALGGRIDGSSAMQVWKQAVSAGPGDLQRWLHGDFYPGNILLRDGRLHAVIDWGCMAVGDPACDLTIAWVLLDGDARRLFREELDPDPGMWERGRGWAFWKALITLADTAQGNAAGSPAARVLDSLLAEV